MVAGTLMITHMVLLIQDGLVVIGLADVVTGITHHLVIQGGLVVTGLEVPTTTVLQAVLDPLAVVHDQVVDLGQRQVKYMLLYTALIYSRPHMPCW